MKKAHKRAVQLVLYENGRLIYKDDKKSFLAGKEKRFTKTLCIMIRANILITQKS